MGIDADAGVADGNLDLVSGALQPRFDAPTFVRKFDGVDVLVPNSYLLEKNVINWTLSDSHHRYDFVIRVSYGASTELVMSTLYRSLEAQPEVLKEPKASVIFEAFGDKALNFHLYYWLDIGRSDTNKVGSEIRLRIDRLCREAGIEIG